ncbi:MAG TPA: geopeptide radical SAM maturase [Candidatus Deferrimicrobiaceae bacterium]
MPLSRYHARWPDPDRPDSWLLYSTKKGSLVRLSGARMEAVLAGEPSDAERAALGRLELWVDDPAAERADMARLVDRTNALSRRFVATVVLTLECNLACPYCFEGDFRDGSAMDEATARLLVDTLRRERIDRGRDVEIRFYGGEPLMALPRLEAIARPLQAAASGAGTAFSMSLVTNGTLLTRPLVEALLPLGLASAQVTLDGPAPSHDRQRPFVSGRGSHDVILANVAAVHDLLTLRLGGNFTRDNYRDFPAMLDDLLAAGVDPGRLDPIQFSEVLPRSGRVGGHDAAGCLPGGDEPWRIEAMLFLREETLKRGFPVDKPSMGICMVELENRIVVNHDGTLYKCPAFMGWPELSVGTLAEGIRDYRDSHRLAFWDTGRCLDCRYLPLCFGGCRLLPMHRHGAIDAPDCRKAYFDAALEKMVIMDLRHRRPRS